MISRMPEIVRCMNEVQSTWSSIGTSLGLFRQVEKKRVLDLTGNAERCSDCLVVRAR